MQFNQPANSNALLKNAVLPFTIENSGVTGKFVRLNEEVHKILSKHKYPVRTSQILGELLVLVVMLGNILKLKGMVTIQAQGSGAISFMSADYTHAGHLRGYAHMNDTKRMRQIDAKQRKEQDITEVFGKGHIVITVENPSDPPYQAIVPLEGKSMTDCICDYFRNSGQLDVTIEVASNKIGRKWHVGGIVVQREQIKLVDNDDAWNYASTLLGSVTDKELIDDKLPMHDLLFRLFHEEGVRVFEPRKLEARCRCSRQRMLDALKSLSDEEIEDMKVKGVITMTCHFCSKKEVFEDGDWG